MNIPKLRGKMVEKGYNVEALAVEVGIDKSTLYRKLNDGNSFTVAEAQKIRTALDLTNEEASAIFFA